MLKDFQCPKCLERLVEDGEVLLKCVKCDFQIAKVQFNEIKDKSPEEIASILNVNSNGPVNLNEAPNTNGNETDQPASI